MNIVVVACAVDSGGTVRYTLPNVGAAMQPEPSPESHHLPDALRATKSECAQSVQRQIYAEIKRDPEVFNAVRARSAEPVIEALAGKLARLANAGYLRLSDPVLAAKQLIALTNAELTDLTALGTRRAPPDEVHRAAAAGVDLFLAAFSA